MFHLRFGSVVDRLGETTNNYIDATAIDYAGKELGYRQLRQPMAAVTRELVNSIIERGHVVSLSAGGPVNRIISPLGSIYVGGMAALFAAQESFQRLCGMIRLVPAVWIVEESNLKLFERILVGRETVIEQAHSASGKRTGRLPRFESISGRG